MNFEELLKRREELKTDVVRVPQSAYEKINYIKDKRLYPGTRLRIHWGIEFNNMVDYGYVFILPGCEDSHQTDAVMYEGIVHIPYPSGGEKENAEPEWHYLIDLLLNDGVKYIWVTSYDYISE